MAYNANIPQATDQLSVSQGQILDNFMALENIANNIAPFLLFPVQSGDPATSATQMALYTKSVSGTPQLFLRRNSNGTVINLSKSNNSQVAGYFYLPCGLLVKWATGLSATGSQLVAFPTTDGSNAIPAFSSVLNVQLTIDATALPTNPSIIYWNPNLTTATNLAVVIKNASSNANTTANFGFWAIGV